MAETFDQFTAGTFPVIDLDTAPTGQHTVIVRFAGKKATVRFWGLARGEDNEHLCIDVHAFVDGRVARSSVFGMEDGVRYEGFGDEAPGRSHGWPAVRCMSVLIGAQADADPKP